MLCKLRDLTLRPEGELGGQSFKAVKPASSGGILGFSHIVFESELISFNVAKLQATLCFFTVSQETRLHALTQRRHLPLDDALPPAGLTPLAWRISREASAPPPDPCAGKRAGRGQGIADTPPQREKEQHPQRQYVRGVSRNFRRVLLFVCTFSTQKFSVYLTTLLSVFLHGISPCICNTLKIT